MSRVRLVLLLVVMLVLAFVCVGGVGATSALATGDATTASGESCANEALVGFAGVLPDCRAYEMVTPSYQNAGLARSSSAEAPPISANGEHVIASNLGGFAGTGNDEQINEQLGAIYEFSRTPTGWVTEPLDPPASRVSEATFQTASADLSKSLWRFPVGVVAGEEDREVNTESQEFEVREGAGPSARFVNVGPADSPSAPEKPNFLSFKGASSDLSHVVFTVETEDVQTLWPGDSTEAEEPSLYQYIGTGNREPTLVAVRNSGVLNGARYINEDAELISKCGAQPGSYPRSTYNAISSDGETIFFTASPCEDGPPVEEVYARLRGAETVAISEPSTGPSGNCSACNESTPADATFEGASSDATKVFFLSEQANLLPGAGGQNLYEYDFDGPEHEKLVRIGASVAEPKVLGLARVSEDGSHVYFVAEAKLAGANAEGKEPNALVSAPYLYDFDTVTGETTFVATLGERDSADWSARDERPVQASEDGDWLAFTSSAQLTSDDDSTEEVPQLFEYNAVAGTLVRASIGQQGSYYCPSTGIVESGYACDGNSSSEEDAPMFLAPIYHNGTRPPHNEGVSISEDGAVFFSSLDALTPESVHGSVSFGEEGRIARENIYEYEAGNVYLLSPPVEPAPDATVQSHFLGSDGSGRDAFFYSTVSLVPEDYDTQGSWYDARLGGGFTPVSPAPSPCSGDSCQGALSPAAALPSVGGSAEVPGGGNVVVAPPRAVVTKPVLTRAQQLAKALKSCHANRKAGKRKRCEASARKRFGAGKAANAKSDAKGKL
jgi:hypothetical protein